MSDRVRRHHQSHQARSKGSFIYIYTYPFNLSGKCQAAAGSRVMNTLECTVGGSKRWPPNPTPLAPHPLPLPSIFRRPSPLTPNTTYRFTRVELAELEAMQRGATRECRLPPCPPPSLTLSLSLFLTLSLTLFSHPSLYLPRLVPVHASCIRRTVNLLF